MTLASDEASEASKNIALSGALILCHLSEEVFFNVGVAPPLAPSLARSASVGVASGLGCSTSNVDGDPSSWDGSGTGVDTA